MAIVAPQGNLGGLTVNNSIYGRRLTDNPISGNLNDVPLTSLLGFSNPFGVLSTVSNNKVRNNIQTARAVDSSFVSRGLTSPYASRDPWVLSAPVQTTTNNSMQDALLMKAVLDKNDEETTSESKDKPKGKTNQGAVDKAYAAYQQTVTYEEVPGAVGPGVGGGGESEAFKATARLGVTNNDELNKENVFSKMAETFNNPTVVKALAGLHFSDGDTVSGAAGWWSSGHIAIGDGSSNIEVAMHEVGHDIKAQFGGVSGPWQGLVNDNDMNLLHEAIKEEVHTWQFQELENQQYGFFNSNNNGQHDKSEEYAVVLQNYAMRPEIFDREFTLSDGRTVNGKDILDRAFKDQDKGGGDSKTSPNLNLLYLNRAFASNPMLMTLILMS